MLRALALCCVLLAAAPRTAAAEWHFTPMAGITFLGTTTLHDFELATGKVHANLGGAVTFLGGGLLGFEAVAHYTPGFFDDKEAPVNFVKNTRTIALSGNVVLTLPQRWTEYSLRPYVSGGFGWMNAHAPDVGNVLPLNVNLPAYNIGAGAVGFLSADTGLRFDFRYYGSLTRPDLGGAVARGPAKLNFATLSVGLVLRR
jgi:hypothetical protein